MFFPLTICDCFFAFSDFSNYNSQFDQISSAMILLTQLETIKEGSVYVGVISELIN